MTHPSDGSLFFLLRLNLQNQDEQEINGAKKGGPDDGFGACKINKCRLCFLSLYFTWSYDNRISGLNVLIMGCNVVTNTDLRNDMIDVCHNFHTLLRVLLY